MSAARRAVLNVPQGWLGPVLIAIFWPLNWWLPGVRTSFLFFPLWLGYIFTMDALVWVRTGTSIITRSRRDFLRLFLISAPAWWLFEMINWRTQNWEYLGGEHFSDLEYFVWASISFSTVMPAVFETAEWVCSFRWTRRFGAGRLWRPGKQALIGLFLGGAVMFGLVMAWPRYCYPLVWGALVLVIEPVNVWLGRRSFFDYFQRGDWRPMISLSVGALMCGFFWEMWNYYSYPKWVYHTPGAQFLHVFEMPLLGYLGYLPFAWELFALRNLAWRQAPDAGFGR